MYETTTYSYSYNVCCI